MCLLNYYLLKKKFYKKKKAFSKPAFLRGLGSRPGFFTRKQRVDGSEREKREKNQNLERRKKRER